MKIKNNLYLIICLLSISSVNAVLITYPQPSFPNNGPCMTASQRYAVEVRQGTGDWIPSFTYYSKGHTPDSNATLDASKSNSWTSFSFSGLVEVKVKLISGNVNNCIVRPKSKGITTTILSSENAVVFTINQPGQFSIEFNGNHKHAMLVFANPPEVNPPTKSTSKVHYFGPGVYNIGAMYGDPIKGISGNNRKINQGDTIYMAGGAYLMGTISCTVNDNNSARTNNVTIMGRGVLSGEQFTRLNNPVFKTKAHIYSLIRLGAGGKIDGITMTDAAGYSITTNGNCHINNVKVLAWYWSTDAYATGYNTITENSFSKVEDDHSKTESPLQTIRNNVYFLQSNGSVLITGYNSQKETVDFGARVTNCDVLHADDLYDDAVIQSVYGGGKTLSNYTFENIRIEGNCTRLFGLAISNNAWASQDKLYGRLTNVTLKNVTLEGKSNMPGYIWGQTSTDFVSNVVFDNISVGGKIVTNLTDANIALGPYVHNVYFKVNGKAVNQEKGFCLDPNIIKLLTPVADCPLSEKNPNENFGTHRNSELNEYWLAEQLKVRNILDNSEEGLIRFENIPVPSTYSKAYLYLFGTRDGGRKATIKYTLVTDDSWCESTSTWNTSRYLGLSPLYITQQFKLGANIIDITDLTKTQNDRKISIKLSEISNGLYSQFDTREALTPFLFFIKNNPSGIGNH